jgi:uncharacterized protein
MDRTPRGILVRAHVSGEASGECSRCLRPLVLPVTIEFEEEYLPTIDIETGASVDLLPGEEESFRISPRHVLDIGDAVRQYWSMALPMAPVCADDCAGICPQCGRDMSSPGHECIGTPADDRWAKLAQLKIH